MNGLGLVLAGGGGKGAYQIGVWKYLHEIGLDQYVGAVSGTSVGALNAALFTAGNFENAEQIWRNIRQEQILSPKRIPLSEIAAWMTITGILPQVGVLSAIGRLSVPSLAPAIATMLGRRASFSRDGLLEIIREQVDLSAIQNSPVSCFATCLEVPNCSVQRFRLNARTYEDIEQILLASSAIPIVFDGEMIDGNCYFDGGIPLVGDNVPVEPIYDLGFEHILVVHLSRDQLIDRAKFPNSRIIEIVPSQDLGGVVDGTLDFTSSGSRRRIQLGYEDARKVLGSFVQTIKLGKVNEFLWQAFQASEQQYREVSAQLQNEAKRIQSEKEADGFNQLCKELNIQ